MMLNIWSFFENPPEWLGWFSLDAPVVRNALGQYPWCSLGGLLRVLDSLLRGVAQVIFVNNPLSGLLMLIGIFVGDPFAGVGAVICSIVAIMVAKLLHLPEDAISAGLPNFSAVLVGTVIAALYPVFFDVPLSPAVWVLMIVAAAFSVFMFAGLGSLLQVHNIPAFTLPFNVAASVTFLLMRAAGYAAVEQPQDRPLAQVAQDIQFEWDKMWLGTLLSAGQVWAVESVACSVLIFVGAALCSPLLTLACYLGGAIGTFISLVVSSGPYDAAYAGVWGYNGFLAGGALVFFMVPTPRVIMLAAINAVLSTFIQSALIPVFAANQLPVFTFPFCLASVLMLAVAMVAAPGQRVAAPALPELHLLQHYQSSRQRSDKEDSNTASPV